MKKRFEPDRAVFLLSLVFLSWLFGFAVASQQWFPYAQLKRLHEDARHLYREFQGKLPFYYKDEFRAPDTLRYRESGVDPGALTLVTRVIDGKRVDAAVINARREVVHRWDLDIFRHWPEPENAPVDTWPRALPGALIHGAKVMENGDLVFNYERFGLMRVDICADPVWKLPGFITHHSVTAND